MDEEVGGVKEAVLGVVLMEVWLGRRRVRRSIERGVALADTGLQAPGRRAGVYGRWVFPG